MIMIGNCTPSSGIQHASGHFVEILLPMRFEPFVSRQVKDWTIWHTGSSPIWMPSLFVGQNWCVVNGTMWWLMGSCGGS